MAVVLIPFQQGISVSEQKCYLLHQGDNQAIIDCLDNFARQNYEANLWVITIAAFTLIALIAFVYYKIMKG